MLNSTNYKKAANFPAEKTSGISMTVPDMTLSLRDLINRHKAGGKVNTYGASYDEGRNIPPDLERMDKVDRAVLARQMSDFVATTRGRLISAREKAFQDAHREKIIAEYEARKAEREKVESINE